MKKKSLCYQPAAQLSTLGEHEWHRSSIKYWTTLNIEAREAPSNAPSGP